MSIDFKRILVPVDFSAHSRRALEHAVYLAKALGSQVEVLNVYDPPFTNDVQIRIDDHTSVTVQEYVLGHTQEQMDQLLAGIEVSDKVEVVCNIKAGVPDEVIVDRSAEGFDLVVMGTHGRRGLARFLMGSVAERVTRQAHCPVLMVREDDDDAS